MTIFSGRRPFWLIVFVTDGFYLSSIIFKNIQNLFLTINRNIEISIKT